MTAEQDGLDLARVKAAHAKHGDVCSWRADREELHCLPYRLAALALDLQGKVARVDALADDCYSSSWKYGDKTGEAEARRIRAALADPPEQG